MCRQHAVIDEFYKTDVKQWSKSFLFAGIGDAHLRFGLYVKDALYMAGIIFGGSGRRSLAVPDAHRRVTVLDDMDVVLQAAHLV